MSKNNRLYNYLVNTFGLSKEVVLEYAESRIDDLLQKHIASRLESNYIENLILNKITQIVQDGFESNSSSHWYSRTQFSDFVKSVACDVLEDRLNKEYKLDVKLVQKDATVVRKVRKK